MPAPKIDNSPAEDRNEKNIATLLPEVRMLARSLVHAAAALNITIKVLSGTRTYAQFTWGGDWTSIHDEPHYELHPSWASKLTEDCSA